MNLELGHREKKIKFLIIKYIILDFIFFFNLIFEKLSIWPTSIKGIFRARKFEWRRNATDGCIG